MPSFERSQNAAVRSNAPFDPSRGLRRRELRAWRTAALALVLSLCWWSSAAHASLDEALNALLAQDEGLPVEVHVLPALGRDAPASSGWTALAVRLHNRSARSLAVTLHVASAKALEKPAAPGASVIKGQHWLEPDAWRSLVVPVPGAHLGAALVLVEHQGKIVGRSRTHHGAMDKPHVFELASHGRLSRSLQQAAEPSGAPAPQAPVEPPRFSSAAAVRDPVEGGLLLPLQVAAYAPATVVWSSASQLERLSNPQWVALSSWVLAGGTLVVSDSNPRVLLTSQRLRLLTGDDLGLGRVSPLLTQGKSALHLSAQAKAAQIIEMPSPTADPRLPGDAYEALHGYQGDNLRDSPWGQTATYGLGEVHLMAFEPRHPPFANEDWTRERVEALVSHARQRQRHLALPLGKQNPDDARSYALRSALNSRAGGDAVFWLCAAALLGMAILAGPVNFSRARRRHAPLHAFWYLHCLSAATLLGVITLAELTRSTHRSVRRISLTEAGAGMNRASITRFRSFYASDLSERRIEPAHSANVLAVVDSDRDTPNQLSYSASGLQIGELRAQPWKLVLVREEGVVTLPGSVALSAEDGDLSIRNRLDRDLLSVVVRTATGHVYFFETIASGTRTLASEGHPVQVVGAPARATHFPLLIHNFDWRMDEHTPGLADTWRALDALRAGQVDWWPPDVPVLLAQLDGGEGQLYDGGLPIESDRALLRVIGYGGRP